MTALELWEEELRAGVDGQNRMLISTWKHDALFFAACCEANARDAERTGCPLAAIGWREKADEYLADEITG